jgi:hypothetical protein
MKRRDLDLVAIIWDVDFGLVSLKQDRALCSTWGHEGCEVAEDILMLEIADEDFKLLHDDPKDPDAYINWAIWENVPALLKHPRFPLLRRNREHRAVEREWARRNEGKAAQ